MTRAAGIAVVTALCAGGTSLAQTQFRAGTDIVEVYATVKLRNGTIAHDLTREDFELRDDGRMREITVFSRSIQPLSVALVLDHSGSTGDNFTTIRLAAQDFVSRLLDADRASIRTLTWDCIGFTEDRLSLIRLLRGFLPPDESSPIWSATDTAMSSLATETGRRIIVLLSDGEDALGRARVARPYPFEMPCRPAAPWEPRPAGDVVARAERDGVMVYTVGIPAVGTREGGGLGELVRLSERSGADYRRLTSYDQLRSAFQSIADELHLQYLLGFVPAMFDGKRHEIEVKAKRSGVSVRARKSYVATRSGGVR